MMNTAFARNLDPAPDRTRVEWGDGATGHESLGRIVRSPQEIGSPATAMCRPVPHGVSYPTRGWGATSCEGVSSHRGAAADGFQRLALEEAVVYRCLTDHDRDQVLDGHPDHARIDRAPDSVTATQEKVPSCT